MTTFLLLTCLLLLWQPQLSLQQRTRNYQLEDSCNLAPVSISLDETVIIKAGGTVSPKPIGVQCKITVMTEGNDLQASVRFLNFRECSVTLSLYALSNYIYTCDNYPSAPITLQIHGTQVIVDLKKTNPTALQYSFEISITPKQKQTQPASESDPTSRTSRHTRTSPRQTIPAMPSSESLEPQDTQGHRRRQPAMPSTESQGSQTLTLAPATAPGASTPPVLLQDTEPFSPDSTKSQPVAAGLVVGIVCGIFFFLVVGAIIIACCYRRAQKLKRLATYNSSNNKVPLETLEGQIGISNNYESSPRAKTKLLSPDRDISVDGSVESGGGRRPQTLDVRSRGPPARSDHTESSTSSRSQKNVAYEHEAEDPYNVMEGDRKPPKSPFLSALQGNVKFQKSRQENERDAKDRRNRLSGSSFGNQTPGESNSSLDSRGKSIDNRGRPLPVVPSNKELTLAEKRKKMESFRRATRPESFTSDELDRSGDDTDNLNRSRGASGSDSQSSKEGAPTKGGPVNSKANTQHIEK